MFTAPKSRHFSPDEYVSYKGETSTFSYTLELQGTDRMICGFGWDANMGEAKNALNNTPKTFVVEMRTDKEVTQIKYKNVTRMPKKLWSQDFMFDKNYPVKTFTIQVESTYCEVKDEISYCELSNIHLYDENTGQIKAEDVWG